MKIWHDDEVRKGRFSNMLTSLEGSGCNKPIREKFLLKSSKDTVRSSSDMICLLILVYILGVFFNTELQVQVSTLRNPTSGRRGT